MKTATQKEGNRQPIGQPENVITLPKQPRQEPRVLVDGHFVVKEFENASGSLSWRVDGYKRDRTRVRENYAEELKARARQIELETEWLKGKAKTEIQATKLTRDQISLAEAAFARLGPDAWEELPAAVDYWLSHGRKAAVSESPRLDDAYTKFDEWLPKSGLRDLSQRNLRIRVSMFANSMPNLKVSDITPEQIDAYLLKREASAKTKDNDRRAISRFFSWCMGYEGEQRSARRWIAANPCRREKRRRVKTDALPAILSLTQCEALLRKAESFERGRLAPYVAVCLFGGVRPFEARRLTWDAVNLKDGEIRLDGTQTKDGGPRTVAICPTLKAWLTAYKNKPFFPANWRRDLDAVKEAAGLVKRETAKSEATFPKKKKERVVQARRYWKRLVPVAWVPDILRHTAISHYFRQTGSYGRTAEQFGNSEAIIKKHYQGRVSTEDTKKFYALLPKKGGRK